MKKILGLTVASLAIFLCGAATIPADTPTLEDLAKKVEEQGTAIQVLEAKNAFLETRLNQLAARASARQTMLHRQPQYDIRIPPQTIEDMPFMFIKDK